MSSSKKKSTSQTKLPDGSKIKEYEVEETHADGTRTITTTQVKTFRVKRTLADGSIVFEDVNTTTTTTKECSQPVQPNMAESFANAFGSFMEVFGGGPNTDKDDACGVMGGDAMYDNDDDNDDLGSKVSKVSKVSKAAYNTKQRHQRQREDDDRDDDGISTLGWTHDGSEMDDLSKSDSKVSKKKRSGSGRQRRQLETRSGGGRRESATDRDVLVSTPEPVVARNKQLERHVAEQTAGRTTNHQQQQQQATYQQPTTNTRQPAAQASAFFQKTHPNNITNINDYQNVDRNLHAPLDDGHYSVSTATCMLYENDRCEQLPTFHKVLPESHKKRGGVGRSIIRSLTPQRMSGVANNNGNDTVPRSYSQSSGRNNGANKNIKLGVRSARGRSDTKRYDKKSNDKNVLDPEVMNAIELIRQRSKSPERGRRSRAQMRQGGRQPQPQPQVQMIQLADQRQAQQEAIVRQMTPQQQQHQPTHPIPLTPQGFQPVYSNNLQHPHDGSLQRAISYSPNAQNPNHQAQMVARGNFQGMQPPAPGTPGTNATGRGQVDFDGLPLGQLANPIQWDNVSDMRDDCGAPDPRGMGPGPPTPGVQKSRAAASRSTKRGNTKSTTKKMGRPKKISVPAPPPATQVKNNQALLPRDTITARGPPKVAIHKSNAILTSDKYVHFYSFVKNSWVQTTTVSLPNTHRLTLALHNNTAVIGVPYDRNSKGLLTGSAYIFEKDGKTHTWYQVKKIVPKKVSEYATVGYSVDICDNVVCVGVPELAADGPGGGGGGSVYVYQRAEQYKWMPMGHLTMTQNSDPNNLAAAGGLLVPPTTKFGTIVALRHKIMVVSNYQPNAGETSLFVYEYDPSIKNKWRLIQTDLLSTEGQRRNFGSHIALTADGEGIFIGCHSEVNPTEILFYKRKSQPDMYGNRSYQLQQIITVQERCNISDFRVDGQENFILGTLDSNRVYIYQQLHDLQTMENQGWRIVAKVVDNGSPSERTDRFGANVGLHDDNILVGTRNNVYSYSLEGWMAANRRKKKSSNLKSMSMMRSGSPNVGKRRGFMSSFSPMRLRPGN